MNPAGPSPSKNPVWFRRGDQAVIASIIGLLLIALGWHWWQAGMFEGQVIEIDRTEPWQVAFQVDINSAEWEELTLLPEIGEQLAKRIVESRDQRGPYMDLNDLRRVRGIGPKTMDRIRPYLVPVADQENVAGSAEIKPAS